MSDQQAADGAAPGGGEDAQAIEMRDEQGRLLRRIPMKDGKPDGELVEFDGQGRPSTRLTFRQGVLHGPAVLLRDGAPQMEMSYAEGLLDGELRSFGPAGSLSAVVRYAAGRREGLSEIFDAEGRPMRLEPYRDDRLDGEVVEYWDEGTVRQRSLYRAGLRDGETVTYGRDGKPTERQVFEKGAALGPAEPVRDKEGERGSRLGRLFRR
jgi:antitoxin component YwqK of YwqJK toxin-antitoxin module